MTNHFPGFRAEASLSVNGRYTGGPVQSPGRAQVVPQLQVQGGLGSFGSQCRAACRCCQRGNYFCCEHCRWCSWPVASGGLLL
jgi:hypothetical protein